MTDRRDPSSDPPGPGRRLLSVAAGTLGLDPLDAVTVAAAAGWPAVGLSVDASSWNDRLAAEVRMRLHDTGTIALDLEVVFATPGGDDGDLIVDAAAAIGARNVLVASLGLSVAEFAHRFAELCDRAAPARVSCVVEFVPFLSIPDLPTALEVIRLAGRPNAGLLVDNLHLARSGGVPNDVATVEPRLLPYVQLCDAPAAAPADLYTEALEGRCLPGEGGLPVDEFLLSVPETSAVSVEILSTRLKQSFPDPSARAREVLSAAHRAVARASGEHRGEHR